MTPRGIRNNNPGNIRKSNTPWIGKTGDDGVFEVFDTPEHGIRALCKIVITYAKKYYLPNIQAIINRWAPPTENDTGSYVNAVCEQCGVQPTESIDVTLKSNMFNIAVGIIKHENGEQPYSPMTIMDGVKMANE